MSKQSSSETCGSPFSGLGPGDNDDLLPACLSLSEEEASEEVCLVKLRVASSTSPSRPVSSTVLSRCRSRVWCDGCVVPVDETEPEPELVETFAEPEEFSSFDSSFCVLTSCCTRRCLVMRMTRGIEALSNSALITPAENRSSHCASSTNRSHPAWEGDPGDACVDRPNSNRSSISANVAHSLPIPPSETNNVANVFLVRCKPPRKRLLWSRRCTPLRWRANATDPTSAPITTARAVCFGENNTFPVSVTSSSSSSEETRPRRSSSRSSSRFPW
mmetsp:Transcript_9074/g.33930  ORF Transcript_9074/g.33930 Transcript_9074/m.33930 type:complete len:274 (+) Transcript_9074:3479-4300(+)